MMGQATVEDLDPGPALSTTPSSTISRALMTADAHQYTHLTVLNPENKALLGYINAKGLEEQVDKGAVTEYDTVEKHMLKFKRKGKRYQLITMDTPLEELEMFFTGGATGEQQEFAVVTDASRRFVLGVATREDLQKFVERRPA